MSCILATAAAAHVKWFCAYDVAGQPTGLQSVLCEDFEKLIALSVTLLLLGVIMEATPLGQALLRAMNAATAPLRDNTELLMRAGCGFFLVAVWTLGGVILTPELKTTLPWVPWLQLALAVCLLWRETMVLAAAGLVFLFGLAVTNYGMFHLMDYPVFIGVAAYLALTGLQKKPYGIEPLDLVRWTAAITLMWASVEKWAYPHWSYELFLQHPQLTLGFDQEFFMKAAGAVEFALSFALVLTPLVRRIGALILMGMFISAIGPFGKIDAIGHAPIIVALAALVGDNRTGGSLIPFPQERIYRHWKTLGLVPLGFATAVASFLAVYYLLHAFLFGTSPVA